jgi:non-specific protein-tyrosine kinase
VVFDSPACLPVTDAQLLAARADGVLLVADIGAARRTGLRYTTEQFNRAHARMLGLVFNKVSGREPGSFGYLRRGYYAHGRRALGGAPANGRGHRPPDTGQQLELAPRSTVSVDREEAEGRDS